MFCLLEDFFVHEGVAWPPKIFYASTSAPPPIPISIVDAVDVDGSDIDIPLEESLQDMDGSDRPFE